MAEAINLLPQQETQSKPQSKSAKLINTISVLVLIIAVVAAVAVTSVKLGLAAQKSSLDKQVNQQKDQVNQYHNQEGTYVLLQNKLKHAQTFFASQKLYSQFLTALDKTVPTSVTFQDLSVDKTQAVLINGITTSFSDLSGFASMLQGATPKSLGLGNDTTPAFTQPGISSISSNSQTGQINFTIKFGISPTLLAAHQGAQ